MKITTSIKLLCGLIVSATFSTSATAAIILSTGEYSENFDDRIATTTSVTGAFSATAGV